MTEIEERYNPWSRGRKPVPYNRKIPALVASAFWHAEVEAATVDTEKSSGIHVPMAPKPLAERHLRQLLDRAEARWKK